MAGYLPARRASNVDPMAALRRQQRSYGTTLAAHITAPMMRTTPMKAAAHAPPNRWRASRPGFALAEI